MARVKQDYSDAGFGTYQLIFFILFLNSLLSKMAR